LAGLLELRISGSGSIDDLRSLQSSINAEHDLRSSATIQRPAFESGSLGAVVEILTVILAPGGAAAILASVLITWIKQRRSLVSVRVKREDGSEIELKADRIKAADAAQLRRLAKEISAALDGL
jgi:Effector Associated Constant Component 1